jgi:AcrR family transcriptional regulator
MEEQRRDRAREAARGQIMAAALGQLAEKGAQAFSLRAVARELGMTAPALYRYFRDRDALVSALVAEAFSSFGDALEQALESRAPGDHFGRMMATCAAYRRWAVGHPQQYGLIFGTPVPGYRPDACIQEAGHKSLGVLLKALNDAHAAGALPLPEESGTPAVRLDARLKALRATGGLPFPPVVIRHALATWSWIHGLVSLELCGQLPAFLGDQVGAFIEQEAADRLRAAGMGQHAKKGARK